MEEKDIDLGKCFEEMQSERQYGKLTVDLMKVIDEKDMWLSGKSKIISYDGCKKIADYCGIVVKETPLFLTQPTADNRQQHIWACFLGFKGDTDRDNRVFVEGEASQLNTGEMVKDKDGVIKHSQSTKIDSKFKSNMAYKRCYCRGVLRLSGLIGIYSAVESPDFNIREGESVDYNSL